MGKFTAIPADTFSTLQLNAGMLLKTFDVAREMSAEEIIQAAICATSGGINASCVPEYTDIGEDVDNCPANMKELKKLVRYECKLSTSVLTLSTETVKISLGQADIDASTGKVTPRSELKDTDFRDLWWVGDMADGGFAAVKLENALSTGGLSLQTTKDGKGQLALELTAHYTIQNQTKVPMEFYVKKGAAA